MSDGASAYTRLFKHINFSVTARSNIQTLPEIDFDSDELEVNQEEDDDSEDQDGLLCFPEQI